MRGKPFSILISLLILCVALQGAGPLLSAQAASPAESEPLDDVRPRHCAARLV
jgi:hypothetical protein